MSHKFSTLFLFLLIINFIFADQTEPNQIEFFELMKKSVAGYAVSDWSTGNGSLVCDLRGVACDSRGRVTVVDLSGQAVSGRFPPRICEYLPELRVLRLGKTGLRGEFPEGVNECALLEELDLRNLSLTGTIPDLSAMKSLRVLALSSNDFRGEFPMSVTNLTRLEVLDFNENGRLSPWRLPENISGLTSLTTMILATCMLYGPIPRSMGNMTALVDLELSGNFLSGEIPPELGRLGNLRQLELYYNQLTGEIPAELGNLTRLVDVDMSVNHLSGSIPESLCRLPELRVLQLYNNSLIGDIPAAIAESTTLTMLSLYDNSLTGEVPRGLGASSPMVVFDLSENHLSGALPTEVCRQGKLQYFLVLDNHFSGSLPDSYGGCHSLLRFRVSNNSLQGPVPGSLLALPHVSIFDVAYNNLSGPIGNSIAGARNLSELFMQNNRISGVLPYEISRALNLVKVDLSNNLISGPIPPEIGNLKRLNLLLLQGNLINSSIPSSLSKLTSVNVLDLSNNRLTGRIPENLSNLLPNSINFSNNLLSGPIPPSLIRGGLAESFAGNPSLCVESSPSAGKSRFPECPERRERDRERRVRSMWAVAAASAVIILAGAVLLARKRLGKHHLKVVEHDEAGGGGGSGGAPSSSRSYNSYEVKSFHRISFDRKEILAAAMDEKNILGRGGSGTVYRVELKSKEVVAVKRLWSERKKGDEEGAVLDRELRTEVETLGSIRHKNIVKLYCYFSSADCNLLVYEYMPNGNLWDALHKGWVTLDWPTRHGIALGIAQGLSYLHHDLVRPIIHRDIKSTNILLDVNYQPKVADFGIAKVLQARGGGKDSTTTVIAGTYGYLAPEYAYLSKATTKCDVYSFGVVMMELITGKKPVELEFGENKNIIYWVANKVETREGAIEVLDKSISSSFKDEMIQALRVAIRCTYKNPALRPTMKEVVQLLIDTDPCRLFDATTRPQCKISVSDGEDVVAKD